MKKKWLYVATWFEGSNSKEAVKGDPHAIDFDSRKEALAFYNEHCNDEHKFYMSVTAYNPNVAWDIQLIA